MDNYFNEKENEIVEKSVQESTVKIKEHRRNRMGFMSKNHVIDFFLEKNSYYN